MAPKSPQKMYLDIHTSTLAKLFLSILMVFALWQIRGIVIIILVSVVFASFIESAAQSFMKIRIPRIPSIVMVYVLSVVAFGGVLYLFIPVFLGELSDFINLLPQDSGITEFFRGISGEGATAIQTTGDPAVIIQSIQERFLSSGGFLQTATTAVGGLANFFLIIVISFYLAVQKDGVNNFLRVVTPLEHEEYVLSLWERTRRKIGLWFQGQLLLAVINMVLTYLGLLLIGVPYALMLSLIAGMFALIPFGIIPAAVPTIVIAFLADGLSMTMLVLGLYIIIQQFENYLFQPLIIKRVTGVPSLMVILSLIIGVSLLGFLGIFLAIPVAVVIMELVTDEEKKKAKILKARARKRKKTTKESDGE